MMETEAQEGVEVDQRKYYKEYMEREESEREARPYLHMAWICERRMLAKVRSSLKSVTNLYTCSFETG